VRTEPASGHSLYPDGKFCITISSLFAQTHELGSAKSSCGMSRGETDRVLLSFRHAK
jgi:hypothetical protein